MSLDPLIPPDTANSGLDLFLEAGDQFAVGGDNTASDNYQCARCILFLNPRQVTAG
jgi:hypothetical protein